MEYRPVHARTALAAAILCGLAATALVAADVAWSLESRLEAGTAQGWQTVAAHPHTDRAYERFPLEGACATRDLRLVVDNDKPFGETVDIRISYFNASAKQTQLVFSETWSLDAWEERTHAFTVPLAAFEPADDADDREVIPSVHVEARVGDQWLSTCVARGSS